MSHLNQLQVTKLKMMITMNDPIIYFEYMIFEAPSLENLNEFLDNEIMDPEEKAAVEHFYNNAQKYGYYWLYGQLKMTPSDPITYEKIEEAIAIHKYRLREYGGPCNLLEIHSIAEHEKKFTLLQQAIEKYYQFQYAPPSENHPEGSKIYQYLAKITNIGK